MALLLSFAFCNYMLTPVQAMGLLPRIAAGDLSQRVEAKSRDEIGVLAMTFNHMTASLDHMTQAQQQRLAELSALHAIGLVTSSTLDLEQLIDSVLEAIVQHLGYDRAKLFLVDAGRSSSTAALPGLPRTYGRSCAPSTCRSGRRGFHSQSCPDR